MSTSNGKTSTPFYGTHRVPRSAWLPFFTPRRLNEKWILTNRMGDWDILENDDYQSLHLLYTPRPLIERLAERRLVLYDDNPATMLERWRQWNGTNYDGPTLHIIHLTQRCNLTCSYCHSSAIPVTAKGRDLKEETALNIVDFITATPSDVISIAFQGGEPTLRPDLIEMILERLTRACAAYGKELRAGITTNGTLLSREVMAVLERYGVRTTFSFDGPKDIHDTIRTYENGQGSYDDAMAGRRNLYRNSLAPLSGAIMVLTRRSIHRVRDIIDEYVEMGQTVIRLKAVTKLGRSKATWDDNAISLDEYWEAYQDAIAYMRAYQEQDVMITEYNLLTALRKILEGQNLADVDSRNPCGLVYGVLNYDIDGKIYACHEGKRLKEFQLGTVDDSVDEILLSKRSAEIAASSVLDQHPECRGCAYLPYCAPCPAHNYQKTRDRAMVPHESLECLLTLKLHDYVFTQLDQNPEPLLAWWRYQKLRTLSESLPPVAAA